MSGARVALSVLGIAFFVTAIATGSDTFFIIGHLYWAAFIVCGGIVGRHETPPEGAA